MFNRLGLCTMAAAVVLAGALSAVASTAHAASLGLQRLPNAPDVYSDSISVTYTYGSGHGHFVLSGYTVNVTLPFASQATNLPGGFGLSDSYSVVADFDLSGSDPTNPTFSNLTGTINLIDGAGTPLFYSNILTGVGFSTDSSSRKTLEFLFANPLPGEDAGIYGSWLGPGFPIGTIINFSLSSTQQTIYDTNFLNASFRNTDDPMNIDGTFSDTFLTPLPSATLMGLCGLGSMLLIQLPRMKRSLSLSQPN